MEAPESTMKAPTYDDGFIFERDGLWFFKWKGGECGFATEEDAKSGLKKLSGDGES